METSHQLCHVAYENAQEELEQERHGRKQAEAMLESETDAYKAVVAELSAAQARVRRAKSRLGEATELLRTLPDVLENEAWMSRRTEFLVAVGAAHRFQSETDTGVESL